MPRLRTYRMGYYLLDKDNNPVRWPDQKGLHWAAHWEAMVREGRTIVKQEAIGDDWLSTVFLGLDHSHFRGGESGQYPHIFETMAFGPRKGDDELGEDFYCQRYGTWQDALEGHENVAQWMRTRNDQHNEAERQ